MAKSSRRTATRELSMNAEIPWSMYEGSVHWNLEWGSRELWMALTIWIHSSISYIPKTLDSFLYIVPENSLSSVAFSVGYILSKCHSNNRVKVKPTAHSLKSRISYNCMHISISNLIKSCYFLPGIELKESIPTYISQISVELYVMHFFNG